MSATDDEWAPDESDDDHEPIPALAEALKNARGRVVPGHVQAESHRYVVHYPPHPAWTGSMGATDVRADLSVLDGFSTSGFAPDWPAERRDFYAPVDDVHSVLKTCVAAASESLVICMYGYDDDELADIVCQKLEAEHVSVQLTLDSSQAGGVHEKALLAREDYPRTLVAVGRSEKGAIMHEKICIVDGILTVTGSTNWSLAGEQKQDNQCTVTLGRAVAAKARARADAIHAHMLTREKA